MNRFLAILARMFSSFRKFLALVLVLLLPLQAVALTTNCCALGTMIVQDATMQMPDDCAQHGMSSASDDASEHMTSHGEGQHASHGMDMSGCGNVNCMLSTAVLPASLQFSPTEPAPGLLPAVSVHFTSFIPDGLHRPPNAIS